jgi:hypothetical protein
MLRVRAVISMCAVALLFGGMLHGQDKKDTKDTKDTPKLKGQLPPNWGKLGLSDKQKQDVYKVQADYKDKMADLEKQLKDLKAKQKTDMEKVLTKEQKDRLREILGAKAPDDKKDKDK